MEHILNNFTLLFSTVSRLKTKYYLDYKQFSFLKSFSNLL